MSVSEVIGCAEHYGQFVKLCRVRIVQLGVTYETLDAICNFSERYTAKLLCEDRAMSIDSFFTLARALALLPIFVHDETQLADLRQREDWIKMRRAGPRFRRKSGGAVRFRNPRDFYRKIGRKGALIGNAARKRRKAAAQLAAAARWGRQ